MIHDIDIILAMIDSEIIDIQANGVNVVTSETDIANARITFKNECIVNLTASRISLKEMRKMRIFQKKSYVNIDFLNKTLEEYLVTDNQNLNKNAQFFPYDDSGNQFIQYTKNDGEQHNALLQELEHFTTSIENNTEPMINGDIGKNALNVALIIQEKING
jgi:predicted dehydrogenase